VNNADSNQPIGKLASQQWLGALALALTVALFAWMFFADIFAYDDIGCEAIDKPLAVGHVLKAREKGVSLREYMQNDPVWADMKSGDPQGSYAYAGKRFQFEFFASQAPLLGFCYVPFVKLFGVSAAAVTLYSTFFATVTVLLMAWLAWKAFDKWHAIAAVLCVTSSLIWLIHIKAAYAAWMPSACLICGMACCLHLYSTAGRRWALGVAAACLGLLYLTGWLSHVAGFFLLALALLVMRRRTWKTFFTESFFVAAITVVTILVVSAGYAMWARCSFWEIHATMFDDMTNRFSLGGVPMLEKLTFPEKLAYAFRRMFLDSTTADHLDKCLEGSAAIPPLFSFFIVAGAFYAIKNRTAADKLVMLWLVSVFALLGAAMTYTHRYALLGLPAMALLASRGVAGLGSDLRRLNPGAPLGYGLLVGATFGITVISTHHSYFENYLLHKQRDFEVDRARGMGVLTRWIKARYNPDDTLVVYGDPIMFARNFPMFYFFDRPFRFKYWSNDFHSGSTTEQVRAWEQAQLARFRRVVFIFSPVLMGDPRSQSFKNDYRPFIAAHGNRQPDFVHAYEGRPLFFAFEVSRESRP
jgi:4-amino-4-deoxy-L-arabinose transferase-like glycosyltransferase